MMRSFVRTDRKLPDRWLFVRYRATCTEPGKPRRNLLRLSAYTSRQCFLAKGRSVSARTLIGLSGARDIKLCLGA